jgi:hypothetical protein
MVLQFGQHVDQLRLVEALDLVGFVLDLGGGTAAETGRISTSTARSRARCSVAHRSHRQRAILQKGVVPSCDVGRLQLLQ